MKNVGVIGAGTMGQGIANAFATAGYNVTVCDIKIEWAQNGINKIGAKLDEIYNPKLKYKLIIIYLSL